jgi:hypothetical protein
MKNYLLLLTIGLVLSQIDIQELREHVENICENPEHKHYDKITLGYITPWYILLKLGIIKD